MFFFNSYHLVCSLSLCILWIFSNSSFANKPTRLICSSIEPSPEQSVKLECEPFGRYHSQPSTMSTTEESSTTKTPTAAKSNSDFAQVDDTSLESVGEQPITEDISRLFLGESEVLLKSKEVELSLGFIYSKNDSAQSLRLTKGRTISIPIGLSVGLSDKLEAFASLPLQYIEREFTTFNDATTKQNSGVGDLNLGFSYQWLKEQYARPSLTSSFAYTFATGEEANKNDPNSLGLTDGFDKVDASLSLTKSIDPAVIFFILGYSYSFVEEQEGLNVQPGSSINYGLGTGFSINNQVSLNWRLDGAYTKETEVDGEKIIASSSEPVSLTVGGTYQMTNKKRLHVDVSTGLNDEASDVSISISYSVRI